MVRVVVCTVARPLVRILVRGGCLGCGYGSVADAVRIVIRWAAVQFVLHVRRHGVNLTALKSSIRQSMLFVIHAS